MASQRMQLDHQRRASAKALRTGAPAFRTGPRRRIDVLPPPRAFTTGNFPLSYYEILGVPKAAGREAVRKAYEDLVKPSIKQATYSADTLFSRACLLKAAAECLLDLELRRCACMRECGP
jgi:hypothetical protein